MDPIFVKMRRSKKIIFGFILLVVCVVIGWKVSRSRISKQRDHISYVQSGVGKGPLATMATKPQISSLANADNEGEPLAVAKSTPAAPLEIPVVMPVTLPQTAAPIPRPALQSAPSISPVAQDDREPKKKAPDLVGTMNMYLAHVSLREPEVADPDSQTNRLILTSMVQKAISNAAANRMSNSPSH
jgi:hypothetical protein